MDYLFVVFLIFFFLLSVCIWTVVAVYVPITMYPGVEPGITQLTAPYFTTVESAPF